MLNESVNKIRKNMGLSETLIAEDIMNEGLKSLVAGIVLNALTLLGSGGHTLGQTTPVKQSYTQTTPTNAQSLTIPIGKFFQSGHYLLQPEDEQAISAKLAEMGTFIKNHPESDFEVTIQSSESQVPNKNADSTSVGTTPDGKPDYARLPKGDLALRRAQTAQSVVNSFVDGLKKEGFSSANIRIGSPELKSGVAPYRTGEDPGQDKFTQEQYTNIVIKAVAKQHNTPQEDFSAYSKRGESVSMGTNTIGIKYYKTRSTQDVRVSGNANTAYEDGVLRMLNPNTGKFTGEVYKVPSAWWNKYIFNSHITPEQLATIKQQNFSDVASTP